jgi:hypothetical protein
MPDTSHGDLCEFKSILLHLKRTSGKNCEDIKTHLMLKYIFLKIVFLWDNYKKYSRVGGQRNG